MSASLPIAWVKLSQFTLIQILISQTDSPWSNLFWFKPSSTRTTPKRGWHLKNLQENGNKKECVGVRGLFEDAPISIKSVMQKIITLSSTEVELIALVQCVQEMMAAKRLLESMNYIDTEEILTMPNRALRKWITKKLVPTESSQTTIDRFFRV